METSKIEEHFLNRLIFGKYKILKKLGKGAFSTVFVAERLIDQKLVAAKIQKKSELYGDIENEAYFLYKLRDILGIPKIYSYGVSGNYYILIQELLGKSLEELFKENKNKPNWIKLKDMLLAGIQIIDRVQTIHSKNILHLDIKPSNFLVGNPDNSLIYIIDFGLSKQYRSSRTGKHVQFSKNKYFAGNICFTSLNSMKGIEPTRRDELESIGYMLIFLYTLKLPWYNIKSKSVLELSKKVYEIKSLISIKMICEETPKEMNEYMEYVRSLKFDENPNYNYLIKLFETMLQKINKNNDLNFSWIDKSLLTQRKKSVKFNNKRKAISPFTKILNAIKEKSENEQLLGKNTISNFQDKTYFNKNINLIKEENIDKQVNNISINKNESCKFSGVKKNIYFQTLANKNISLYNKNVIQKLSNSKNNNIIKNKKILTANKKYNKYKTINENNNKNNDSNIINKKNNLNQTNIKIRYNNSYFINPIISNKIINIYSNQRNNPNRLNYINNYKRPRSLRGFASQNNIKEKINKKEEGLIDNNIINNKNYKNCRNNKLKDDYCIFLYSDINYKRKFHN